MASLTTAPAPAGGSRYFLGVDVGGTKSHALIADETGQAVGFAEAGPGNHEVVGYPGLTAALKQATSAALAMVGIGCEQVAGAGFGVAGYDWPSERAPTLAAVETLGLQAPLEVVNDTIIGLLAGAEAGWGVAVVAGTGANCWGWDRQRNTGRVMGNGYLFGENGGAGELVITAVQQVVKDWTRRGPGTALTAALVEFAGASSCADLLEGLSQGVYTVGAEAAPLVFSVAESGDAVASEVIRWAGRELGSLATGVIRQLGFERLEFELVLVGSMFNDGPLLLEPMQEVVGAVAPGARYVRLTAPPVAGAVLLAMEQAGLATGPLRSRLIASTRDLLHRQEAAQGQTPSAAPGSAWQIIDRIGRNLEP